MGKKVKESRLAKISALTLSLIILFGSPLILIALAGIGELIGLTNNSSEMILCSFYPILIAVACFIICRLHPQSIWYTPIICNAYSIIPAILDSNFWSISFWTTSYWTGTPKIWMFHCAIVLSVIGAVIVVIIRKRVINQAK